jgi:hypothetical protein
MGGVKIKSVPEKGLRGVPASMRKEEAGSLRNLYDEHPHYLY